jgi:hypothetical protein
MGTKKLFHFVSSFILFLPRLMGRLTIAGAALAFITTFSLVFAESATAADLKVMKTGLGSGTVTSSIVGINCGADCNEAYGAAASVTLTATPAADSVFVGWRGDCVGAACTLTMGVARSVRAEFALTAAIPELADFTPTGIQTYLTLNPQVNSAARFVKALPAKYKQNWILMSRSESLQTGIAAMPRILMPSPDAKFVFTVGLASHSSYPGAHPDAIEYMQWDATEKNFRFHEIVLAPTPAMGSVPPRVRGVNIDDEKCSRCHSTRNVLNRSTDPGTTGIPVGLVKAKNKPNWDPYDSWAGMLPFNRDKIFQGSVEAAAFRKLFNPWTWRDNAAVRSVIEQLELQPPGILPTSAITRIEGGANDGHVNFAFDTTNPTLTEPPPTGSGPTINTAYEFNNLAGVGAGTTVVRDGSFVLLQHSETPTSSEGRGVQLFDLVGGADGNLNQQRIADELASHRYATGSVALDVRPIALAVNKSCVNINAATNTVTSASGSPALTINLAFFNSRNGMSINQLFDDTRARTKSMPRRKADIQRLNLQRDIDEYLAGPDPANGLVAQYGATTAAGTDSSLARLRQEVFRRGGGNDQTVMGGIYVDREDYSNTTPVALYRYFLEPLGVSVDKWSMGVRGRSRTYAFADVFSSYTSTIRAAIEASLSAEPVAGLAAPYDCTQLINAVNSTLSSLPAVNAAPTFTDVQRIFNKGCIECHGGLNYPPYSNYSSFPASHINFSEDENPPAMVPPSVSPRLARSYETAVSLTTTSAATSYLYQRITGTTEDCPDGLMPCGGPPLSKTDIETIRRWIEGPPSQPSSAGDPHMRTADGVNYDFQSAGEFTLLRNEYLEVQARHTAVSTEVPLVADGYTGLSSCASVTTAVAVRIGAHRITYQPHISGKPDPTGMELRIDGKLVQLEKGEILLPSGGRIIRTSAPGGIQIEGAGGAVIIITPHFWNHYQIWWLHIDTRNTRATEGVIGVLAAGSWLPALPDGSGLGPKPAALHDRYLQLYDKFANAWRVRDKSTLFDYAPGTSTKTFQVKTWPEENPKVCLAPPVWGGPIDVAPLKALPLDTAAKYCSNVFTKDRLANCIQDVRTTGEPEFAKAYLLTEEINRNRIPAAPVLEYPKNNERGSGETMRFIWNLTKDPDGDVVTYRHCTWAAGEKPTFNDCDAAITDRTSQIVSKYKSGQVYFWKVIAEDTKGGSVESETRRFTIK